MAAGRRYSEREISEILKLAVRPVGVGSSDISSGISLEELEKVAAELGIPPDRLREAARVFDESGETHEGVRFFPNPRFESASVVDGELHPDDWADVVAVLRKEFGIQGEVETLGSSFNWSSAKENATGAYTDKVSVLVRPRGGKTNIDITTDRSTTHGLAAGLGIGLPAFLAMIASIAVTAEQSSIWWMWILAIVSGMMTLGGFVRWSTWRGFSRKRSDQRRILERITKTIEELVDQREATTTPSAQVAEETDTIRLRLGKEPQI